MNPCWRQYVLIAFLNKCSSYCHPRSISDRLTRKALSIVLIGMLAAQLFSAFSPGLSLFAPAAAQMQILDFEDLAAGILRTWQLAVRVPALASMLTINILQWGCNSIILWRWTIPKD